MQISNRHLTGARLQVYFRRRGNFHLFEGVIADVIARFK